MKRAAGNTPPGKQLLLIALPLLLLWLLLLASLTTVDQKNIVQWEFQLRAIFLDMLGAPNRWYIATPPYYSEVQHFLSYLPLGIFAGLIAEMCRRYFDPRYYRLTLLSLVSAFALFALIEELRQFWVPTRGPSFSDLFSGWSGITLGLLIYKVGERIVERWIRLYRKRGR